MGRAGRNCPLCGKYLTIEELITSPDVEAIGMTLVNDDPKVSVFYFNHLPEGCKTTFVLPLVEFEAYIHEDIPEIYNAGGPTCPGYCLDVEKHEPCEAECHNAPYRRFLHEVLMGGERRARQVAGTEAISA